MARRKTTLKRSASGQFLPRGSHKAKRNPRGVYRHKHGVLRAVQDIPEGVRISGLTQLTRNPFGGLGALMPSALIVNPSRRRRVKRRRVTRRRRRRSVALVAAPRRRRRISRKTRSRRRVRHAMQVYASHAPVRHRRRRRARSTTLNPSNFLAGLKRQVLPSIVGTAAGFGAGMLDTKLLGAKPMISVLAKIGAATIGAALLAGKLPQIATAFASGIMGTVGYSMAVKLGGGYVALTKAGALQGMADMAEGDEEFSALLQGMGLGVLTPGVSGMDGMGDAGDSAAADYDSALADSDSDLTGDDED
jgi:hypothetical protein